VQPLFYFWYGQACDRAGHVEACERQIERYLAANPNSGEALNYLAYMWAEQGRNLDRAMDYVAKALKLDPDNGAYLDTLGWIYFKRGDADSAVTYLTRAVKREGDAPAIMEHLGDAWYALKKRDKAVSLWLKSLKLAPENQGLRNKLIAEQVEARRLPPVPAKGQVKQTGRFPL
jgi:tetratricopeptide (TPR) repeat protein